MSEALFYDPAVLRAIRAILVSRGIRAEHDLEDGIGEVVLAAVKYVRKIGRAPDDVAHAIGIVRPIANAHGISEARKRVSRGQTNLGPTEGADEHAAPPEPALDPVDKARMLATVRRALKDDQIEVLADVGAGVEQKELAVESNASGAAMRKRVQKSRETARSALGARGYWVAGGFAALLAAFVAVYVGRSPAPGVVTHGRSPRELADQERRDASSACKEQRWDACERALDRAAQLDAQGDHAADVTQMRAAIAAGRRGPGPEGGADSR